MKQSLLGEKYVKLSFFLVVGNLYFAKSFLYYIFLKYIRQHQIQNTLKWDKRKLQKRF